MAARPIFDEELHSLNSQMTEMGELVKEAIEGSFDAVAQTNPQKAIAVAKNDSYINEKERDIERLCLRLLLREQPVATDLRTVTSALKMITDFERIGDQAAEICEIATGLPQGLDLSQFSSLSVMAKKVVDQVNLVVDAYLNLDIEKTQVVVSGDKEINALFDDLKRDITAHIVNHVPDENSALDVLMIGKYLERIGDHVVNIAEWVEYAITGNHKGMTIADEAH
ncbi:MAG TPA: phosphate signaling complex protein PhoU [Eggerthellaceae bacterium]|nr:phosphate signaling complex protein PhoU [Eggerthellaceae bacterium]